MVLYLQTLCKLENCNYLIGNYETYIVIISDNSLLCKSFNEFVSKLHKQYSYIFLLQLTIIFLPD